MRTQDLLRLERATKLYQHVVKSDIERLGRHHPLVTFRCDNLVALLGPMRFESDSVDDFLEQLRTKRVGIEATLNELVDQRQRATELIEGYQDIHTRLLGLESLVRDRTRKNDEVQTGTATTVEAS